ncbi:MAG: dihydroorotase [Gammaproteobacteria bacterium]|nr:dihydroorotase [Gammaproteobacteria bacterium]
MRPRLDIIRPDDWHIHFRDGAIMPGVAAASAEHFARGIIMPNLVPPVVTYQDAQRYHQRIADALGDATFEPLMTLYLTDGSDPADVREAINSGLVKAVKLYPAGATTNSASGVTDINQVSAVLEVLAETGTPLCVHGEVTSPEIDIFDREAVFIDTVLSPLQQRLPELRVVMEHITTKDGADYVRAAGEHTAATVTPHHLMINRNHILVGGIRPHYYCLPVAKRELHRLALREAVTSGHHQFFLGTDSAPHVDATKESACGCAGVFNAPTTLACLAHVFEEENALDQLENFTSLNGPAFYRLPVNQGRVILEKKADPVTYPAQLETPAGPITVFDPGHPLYWRATVDTA